MLSLPVCSTSSLRRPVGLMDKASASGAGDSRFESWAGQALTGVSSRSSGSQRLEAQVLKWNYPSRSWCKARARRGLQPRSQVAPAERARKRPSAAEKSVGSSPEVELHYPSRSWRKARARQGLQPRSQVVPAERACNRVSAAEKSAATLRRQLCSGCETLISPE